MFQCIIIYYPSLTLNFKKFSFCISIIQKKKFIIFKEIYNHILFSQKTKKIIPFAV
jgi:hypothetical protein